jgi:2-polyprenyl-3-methyl-5-hydroxy-6-metoxy-1,4-benzoquinol methylase
MTENNAAKNIDTKPDVKKLMQEIRERIKQSLAQDTDDKLRSFTPKSASPDSAQYKAGSILHSDELRYLNENYSYMPRLQLEKVQSHRFGFIGKVLVSLKRKVLVVVWDFLLKDYFENERQFQARLVRLLNEQTKYTDARDAANFWEIIRKIDVDVSNSLERIERIRDEYLASLTSLEKRLHADIGNSHREINVELGALKASEAKFQQAIQTHESIIRGLEYMKVAKGFSTSEADLQLSKSDSKQTPNDYSYLLLENRYRGSETELKERQTGYVEIFKNIPDKVLAGKVLEIGPGRGELQRLFNENQIPCYGIDIDQAMVERSQSLNLDVNLGDGIAHLRNLKDSSLAGIIALQVVEHLTHEQLMELCRLAKAKVSPQGRIVFETINPLSLLALSAHYFRDPTHQWPLHPETLEYTMTLAGLKVIEIRPMSLLPETVQLQKLNIETGMPPRWNGFVETYNLNTEKLNKLIYGNMDYCIIAEV